MKHPFASNHGIDDYEIDYLISSNSVLDSIENSKTDFGIFAMENAQGGVVIESVEALALHKAKYRQLDKFCVSSSFCAALGLAGLATVSVLEAGGKPSTWFPPEGLVELTTHARCMQMYSNDFLMKNLKFSKIHKNIIFLKIYQNFEVTFNIDLVEQINK